MIAICINNILSMHISKEKFAFLNHRQIHEAIGITQEGLHLIELKNLKKFILKIDLSKSFDRACLTYLQLILTHIDFPHSFMKWIMCCFTFASYSILINGFASNFFHNE